MKDGMRLGGHAALQYTSEGLIKLTIPKNRGGEDEPASMLGPVEPIYGTALGLVAAELPAHELSVRVLIDNAPGIAGTR